MLNCQNRLLGQERQIRHSIAVPDIQRGSAVHSIIYRYIILQNNFYIIGIYDIVQAA